MIYRPGDDNRFAVYSIVVFIILVSSLIPVSASSEQITGMVVGGAHYKPFWILSIEDPMLTLDVHPLPGGVSIEDKRKLDRIYYPRTRKELLDYEIMVFHSPRIQHFLPRQVHDLDYAFREGEMAAFCGLTGLGIGWEHPVLLEVIPIHERSVSPYYRGYRVRFRRNRDQVFLPFLKYGAEKVFGSVYTEMYIKQGATVWGDIVPYDLPWMVSWRPGGGDPGILWNVAHRFDSWWDESNNPYALDVATNMIFYSLDMELIGDIPARREARRMFRNIRAHVSLIISMMSWAESFGANTAQLYERLTALEREAEGAAGDYMAQDYEAAIEFLESLLEEVQFATAEAVRLKDEALMWVYLVEWFAVSGTSAFCGFALWTVMIRRRSYREVETTRFQGPLMHDEP